MTITASIHCGTLETSDHFHHDSTACESKQDGIYADYSSDCKKFFVCEKNQMFNFDCPPSTRFYERFETCSFVPNEELKYFVCNSPNQLEEPINRQSLHRDGHALDLEDAHRIIDRRTDAMSRSLTDVHPIEVMKIGNEHDLDYLKHTVYSGPSDMRSGDQAAIYVMQASEAEERRNKFRNERDGDESYLYRSVPFKGHEYQDDRVLEPAVMSPQLKSKPTRLSKKLTPCQKAASSRRNDRKSKRFERSVKCLE